MKGVLRTIDRFLRGVWVSGQLRRLGIDPRRYWLLMDLFGELSQRRELFSQLGRDSISLQSAAWAYYILSTLLAIPFLLLRSAPVTYFAIFLGFTGFLLLSMLLSETSNSLVNPVEAMVLAHQPVNGATYTAAKLTHLLRMLVHMVPGLTLIPALAAFMLKGCRWFYPLLFLAAAFALGLVVALGCCALFGWLIRLVPASRLKTVAMTAEASPWLLYMLMQFTGVKPSKWHVPHWLPADTGSRALLAGGLAVAALAVAAMGIRALSGDYLVRVAAIAQGGSSAKHKVRRSPLGGLVARICGGPPARAGFDYLSRMMLRDWQFRRQSLQLIPMTLMLAVASFQRVRTSPFSGEFTPMHIFPHLFGVVFFSICTVMGFGADHKGAWLFLLAPGRAYGAFARGVYARMLTFILAPHALLLALLGWFWGLRDASLFLAFSMALASFYLALEVRLIEGLPFSRQPESTQNLFTLPLMVGGAIVMAFAVALQYFVIFRSALFVILITLALAAAAARLTRSGVESMETSIRFHLGNLTTESKGLYTEVS